MVTVDTADTRRWKPGPASVARGPGRGPLEVGERCAAERGAEHPGPFPEPRLGGNRLRGDRIAQAGEQRDGCAADKLHTGSCGKARSNSNIRKRMA
jgi:hypothetical protein